MYKALGLAKIVLGWDFDSNVLCHFPRKQSDREEQSFHMDVEDKKLIKRFPLTRSQAKALKVVLVQVEPSRKPPSF